jgi:hypothetical protein
LSTELQRFVEETPRLATGARGRRRMEDLTNTKLFAVPPTPARADNIDMSTARAARAMARTAKKGIHLLLAIILVIHSFV